MGQFVAGVLAGSVMCVVIMLIRCALWFEKRHPEDDYWHRLSKQDESEKGVG